MDLDFEACRRAFVTRDPRFDGRIFGGVKTTGIYCRPICPARTPKPQNMTFYPSAAAAQDAGYRPCLRCRPETSPDLGAWRGTSNTVSRALALIEAGAMDAGDVDALAARLGVGERQLRRLFRQHLGASPVSVAQTRRVLLAKQLIQETRLPMGEVALASGFGSVRRFNETFQQLFGRPPGELRRTRQADIPAADGITVRLPYKPPYDWDAIIRFLRDRAIPGIEVVEPGRYARTLAIDGLCGVVIVTPRKDGALSAEIHFPAMRALPAVIARIRRVFDLSADPTLIGAHLSQDPALAPLVAARPGLRAPGAWDGFELAVRAILGQQITVTAARNLAAKLVDRYGAQIDNPAAARLGLTRRVPDAGPARRRGYRGPWHAPVARCGAGGLGPHGGRRPDDLHAARRPAQRHRRAQGAAGRRRVDRPVHRAARDARARRLPAGRHRADAGDGRRGRGPPHRRPAVHPQPGLAPVARLRRPAPVGRRSRLRQGQSGDARPRQEDQDR